jgi:hypothetical protein
MLDRNPNHILSEAQIPRDHQTRNIPDYIFEENQEKTQAGLSVNQQHHAISSFSLIEKIYLNLLLSVRCSLLTRLVYSKVPSMIILRTVSS